LDFSYSFFDDCFLVFGFSEKEHFLVGFVGAFFAGFDSAFKADFYGDFRFSKISSGKGWSLKDFAIFV